MAEAITPLAITFMAAMIATLKDGVKSNKKQKTVKFEYIEID